jgi:hypothetical protein
VVVFFSSLSSLACSIHSIFNRALVVVFVACVCGVFSFRWMVHVRWETIFAICTFPSLLFLPFSFHFTHQHKHTCVCVYVCVYMCLSYLIYLHLIPRQRMWIDRPITILQQRRQLRAGKGVRNGASERVPLLALFLQLGGVAAVRVGLEETNGAFFLFWGVCVCVRECVCV